MNPTRDMLKLFVRATADVEKVVSSGADEKVIYDVVFGVLQDEVRATGVEVSPWYSDYGYLDDAVAYAKALRVTADEIQMVLTALEQ